MKKLIFVLALILLFGFPIFAQTEKKAEKPNCQIIYVTPPPSAPLPGEIIKFVATIDWKNMEETKIDYIWTVDKGEIVDGQGTSIISVRLKGNTDNASVEIKGLPEGCENTTSNGFFIAIDRYPYIFDEFSNIPLDELQARFDNLFIRLDSDPNATGYVVNYGLAKNIKSRENVFKESIKLRKFDAARIVFVNGGEEKEIRTRLWIVPAGADPSGIN